MLKETEFRLKETPAFCEGEFVFRAYCKYENPDHDPIPYHDHSAESHYEAITELRAEGWRFHRNGLATCPKCNQRIRDLGLAPQRKGVIH